jgi:hypothetical protein
VHKNSSTVVLLQRREVKPSSPLMCAGEKNWTLHIFGISLKSAAFFVNFECQYGCYVKTGMLSTLSK